MANDAYHVFQALLQTIKAQLRRSYATRFALAIISLGLTMFAAPELWEYAIQLLSHIAQLGWPEFDYQPPSHQRLPGWIAGGALILGGLGIFAIEYRRKTKQPEETPQVIIIIDGENNYIIMEYEETMKDDPEYAFQIPFSLTTKGQATWLLEIEATHYVRGCSCYCRQPTLKSIKNSQPIALTNYRQLTQPMLIPPHSSTRFLYQRVARGPRPGFIPTELEEGEYRLDIRYRSEDSSEETTHTTYLRQEHGALTAIKSLAPPPILNNEQITNAREQGIISPTDEKRLHRISERDRYLLVRFGENHREFELRYELTFVRACHKKIQSYEQANNSRLQDG